MFVYREGFVGKAVGWNVALDGIGVAQLKSPRFTRISVPPGRHTLSVSLGLRGFAGTQNKPPEMAFEAQAGEILVYAMKAKMGALRTTLYFTREADAPAAMQKLARVPMVETQGRGGAAAA